MMVHRHSDRHVVECTVLCYCIVCTRIDIKLMFVLCLCFVIVVDLYERCNGDLDRM